MNRAWIAGLAGILLVACAPKATVRKTAPVADLRPFHALRLRVAGGEDTGGYVQALQNSTLNHIRAECEFTEVLLGEQQGSTEADLVVDLNIHRAFRGGDGIIKNPNLATVDVLMVLSDTIADDLVGSAWIRGQSSQVFMSGAIPEVQAVDAVAESVAKILSKSGCKGPRIAREQPEPEPPPVEEGTEEAEARARAEAINDEGKQMFRGADISAAAAKFEEAIAVYPDPRYVFNLCFAYETLKQYDRAINTCKRVFDMQPDERLLQKTETRIAAIKDKRAGGE